MKNIYTTKFNGCNNLNDRLNKFCDGLNNKTPYIHSTNLYYELVMRENYFIHGKDNYLNQERVTDIDKLNSRSNNAKYKQAYYILNELGKLAGKEEYINNIIRNKTGFTSNDFKELYDKLIQDEDGIKLDEDAVKQIFDNSCDIPLDDIIEIEIDPDDYENEIKNDEVVLNYNLHADEHDNEFTQINNQAITNVVKAMGFDIEDVKETFKKIINSDYNTDIIFEEYQKYITKRMEQFPVENRTEEKFVFENDKLLRLFDRIGQDQTGHDLSTRITNYMETPRFRTFAIRTTSCKGVASILASDLDIYNDSSLQEDVKYGTLIKSMKHVQEEHARRSAWSRFKDWFNPNGEYRTIERCKKALISKGYTEEQINQDLARTKGEATEYNFSIEHYVNLRKEHDGPFYLLQASSEMHEDLEKINVSQETTDTLKEAGIGIYGYETFKKLVEESYEEVKEKINNHEQNDISISEQEEITNNIKSDTDFEQDLDSISVMSDDDDEYVKANNDVKEFE